MGFQESYNKASEQYENREPKWSDSESEQVVAYGRLERAKKEKIGARFLEEVGGWELYAESTGGADGMVVEYVGKLDSFTEWLSRQDVEEIW